jgi:hypothetical protein
LEKIGWVKTGHIRRKFASQGGVSEAILKTAVKKALPCRVVQQCPTPL